MNDVDRHLCLWINGWPEWLSPFLTFFSDALHYVIVKVFFGAVLIAMLWRGPKSRVAAVFALLALGLANGMTDVFKHLLPMHRPFQLPPLDHLLTMRVGTSPSMGTASAHSANMAALATVTTLLLGRWGWPWIAVALLTGISRVYVGAHFPSQVLLGWLCGVTSGVICVSALRLYGRRHDAKK